MWEANTVERVAKPCERDFQEVEQDLLDAHQKVSEKKRD